MSSTASAGLAQRVSRGGGRLCRRRLRQDRATALNLFRKAWQNEQQLDPAIRQQLNQPQQTDKVVAQIKEQLKEQVANEMREQARQTPGPGAAMQPMPPQ